MADTAHNGKTADRILTVQNGLLGTIASVMLAGIPWAYMIGNKVTAIEVTLSQVVKTEARIAGVESRVERLRSEMDWLRGKGGAKEP